MIYIMPTTTIPTDQLAYVAGIIDGEGSIGIYGRVERRTFRTVVRVSMCEPEAVQLLHSLFGGHVNLKPKPRKARQHHRPQYEWLVAATIAADCLRQIVPFLRIKRQQALNVLRLQEVNQEIRAFTTKQRALRRGPTPRGSFQIRSEAVTECRRLYFDQKRLNQRGVAA